MGGGRPSGWRGATGWGDRVGEWGWVAVGVLGSGFRFGPPSGSEVGRVRWWGWVGQGARGVTHGLLVSPVVGDGRRCGWWIVGCPRGWGCRAATGEAFSGWGSPRGLGGAGARGLASACRVERLSLALDPAGFGVANGLPAAPRTVARLFGPRAWVPTDRDVPGLHARPGPSTRCGQAIGEAAMRASVTAAAVAEVGHRFNIGKPPSVAPLRSAARPGPRRSAPRNLPTHQGANTSDDPLGFLEGDVYETRTAAVHRARGPSRDGVGTTRFRCLTWGNAPPARGATLRLALLAPSNVTSVVGVRGDGPREARTRVRGSGVAERRRPARVTRGCPYTWSPRDAHSPRPWGARGCAELGRGRRYYGSRSLASMSYS